MLIVVERWDSYYKKYKNKKYSIIKTINDGN